MPIQKIVPLEIEKKSSICFPLEQAKKITLSAKFSQINTIMLKVIGIPIREIPPFQAGECYNIYIYHKDTKFRVKIKSTFTNLMIEASQRFQHHRLLFKQKIIENDITNTTVANSRVKILDSAMQDLIPQWLKRFSSEDFKSMEEEGRDQKFLQSDDKLQCIIANSLVDVLHDLSTFSSQIRLIKKALKKGDIEKALDLTEALKNKEEKYLLLLKIADICLRWGWVKETKEILDRVPDPIKEGTEVFQKYNQEQIFHFQDLFDQTFGIFKQKAKKSEPPLNTISEFIPLWLKQFSSEDFDRLVKESKEREFLKTKNETQLLFTLTLRKILSHLKKMGPILELIEMQYTEKAIELAEAFEKKDLKYFALILIADKCLNFGWLDEAMAALVKIPDGTPGKDLLINKITQLKVGPPSKKRKKTELFSHCVMC